MKTKTYLKKILILAIVMMVNSNYVNAQTELYVAAGADLRMAVQGAHLERKNNKPSLDLLAAFGFDFPNSRLSMKYQSHEAISFYKWTYMAYDHKLTLNRFRFYGGLEVGQIKRGHADAHYSKPNNYRRVVINPVIWGANLELQYRIGQIGFAAQYNVHQAEDDLKPYKKYRQQVHVKIIVYLAKLNTPE